MFGSQEGWVALPCSSGGGNTIAGYIERLLDRSSTTDCGCDSNRWDVRDKRSPAWAAVPTRQPVASSTASKRKIP